MKAKSWSNYYQALTGRPPRPLCLEAVAHCDERAMGEAARWVVDLGCGDGTETLALLQTGWHVLAIDQQPEAIRLVRSKVPPEQAVSGPKHWHVFDLIARKHPFIR